MCTLKIQNELTLSGQEEKLSFTSCFYPLCTGPLLATTLICGLAFHTSLENNVYDVSPNMASGPNVANIKCLSLDKGNVDIHMTLS